MPTRPEELLALLEAEEAFEEGLETDVLRDLGLAPGKALLLPGNEERTARWLVGEGWEVTLLEPDPEAREGLSLRFGAMAGLRILPVDPYGPGELSPLEDHFFDLAVGLGAFEQALTPVAIDSLLYGLARVLKPDGRALLTVRHESSAPQEPRRQGPRPLASGESAVRTLTLEDLPEEDPARPEELSPLIPLIRLRRSFELQRQDGGRRVVEAVRILRLWDMSEVLQVAHRCLVDVSRRWRNHRDSATLLELRVPPVRR